MLIEELIGDLLVRHNCVVIPSFGGFVAGQLSATFDRDKGVMLPPRKSLLFNKQLINNDGLLVAAYAHATQQSYNDAFDSVQVQIKQWNRKLVSGERIEIERVGFLYLDGEKNIGFEQDRFNNLLLQSFGLGNVHFLTEEDILIVKQVEEQIEIALNTEENITPIRTLLPVEEEETPIVPISKASKQIWKYVAAAVLLPICFYTYWIPMKTKVLESGVLSFRDFNPFYTNQSGTYVYQELDLTYPKETKEYDINQILNSLPEEVEVFSYPLTSTLYVPVKIREHKKMIVPTPVKKEPIKEKEVVKQKAVEPIRKTNVTTTSKKTAKSHLIVGCFSSEINANKLIEELKAKGFNAYKVDVNKGLHRVSACNSDSDSILSNAKDKLKPLGISGWILRD